MLKHRIRAPILIGNQVLEPVLGWRSEPGAIRSESYLNRAVSIARCSIIVMLVQHQAQNGIQFGSSSVGFEVFLLFSQ